MKIGHKSIGSVAFILGAFLLGLIFVLPSASAHAYFFGDAGDGTCCNSPSYVDSIDYSYDTYTPSYVSSIDYTYPVSNPSYVESIDYTYPASSPSYVSSIDYYYPSSYPTYTNTYSSNSNYNSNSNVNVVSYSGGTNYCVTSNCGGGCTHNCNPAPKPAPTCTINFSPSQISYNGNATITWSSSNATNAYLSGYGSVSPAGSHVFNNLTSNQNYTLTVSGQGGSANCNVVVVVASQPAPTCSISLSRNSLTYPINYGNNGQQPVTIYWSSNNTQSGWINQNIGNVGLNGSQTVYPNQNTTYTGTFVGTNGQQVTCSATVTMNNYVPPVTPYVTLSAVPYTGLELGPVGTALYWGFLIAWCLLAAYLIVIKRLHMAIYRWYMKVLFGSTEAVTFVPTTHNPMVATHVAPAPAQPAPVGGPVVDPFILSQINRARN